jgi:REP element-mobilizing transposase RayT
MRVRGVTVILAFHSIISAYGFWLPNDPRGSWSDFVRAWELLRFGPATKVTTRQSVAATPHDRHLRESAKEALKYPPVHFTGIQARAIAYGFKDACEESGYVVFACAILPEHAHLIIGRHGRNIRRIVGHLKGRATQRLLDESLFPDDGRPVWARGGWNVFVDDPRWVHAAIAYVENNPAKEGKRRQRWSFVTPYESAAHPI